MRIICTTFHGSSQICIFNIGLENTSPYQPTSYTTSKRPSSSHIRHTKVLNRATYLTEKTSRIRTICGKVAYRKEIAIKTTGKSPVSIAANRGERAILQVNIGAELIVTGQKPSIFLLLAQVLQLISRSNRSKSRRRHRCPAGVRHRIAWRRSRCGVVMSQLDSRVRLQGHICCLRRHLRRIEELNRAALDRDRVGRNLPHVDDIRRG